MTRPRPCLGDPVTGEACGEPTLGSRCERHRASAERGRHNQAYDTGAYRSARKVALERWVAANGWVCPGDEAHGRHASRRLTADHPDPLARGGALVQEFRIVCVSGNSRRRAGGRRRAR